MSTVKVNKITPRTSNSIQLGESGDTLTIPSGATLQNCGTATGFGISFCTTVKTSPFTATAGKGFFINTGSAVTVTLPASPSAGDELIVIDSTGQAATNNITLGRNGSKIKGQCIDAKLNVDRGGLRIVYSGASQGWITATAGNDATADTSAFITATGGTITTVCTNYKVHTFTSDGTFCVSAGSGSKAVVSYMVIAGGAGGGGCYGTGSAGGGGGAGGYREGKANTPTNPDSYTASPIAATTGIELSPGPYSITVGGGGAGSCVPSPEYSGNPGSNSVFSTITSAGGGGGGTGYTATFSDGKPGGSGGGAGSYTSMTAGTGNTPPVSPPQGNSGGIGYLLGSNYNGGGGGGSTVIGGNGGAPSGGNGGAGATSSINGTPTTRGGGGGGGSATPSSAGTGGSGGGGGGGQATPSSGDVGDAGTANTGGGGGGSVHKNPPGAALTGGAGGSGLVIIRYKFQ